MNEVISRLKEGGSPYNEPIELTARGRHALCGLPLESAPWAKVAPVPYGPFSARRALRPCSQLIGELYGSGALGNARGRFTIHILARTPAKWVIQTRFLAQP